jgi:RNA polymerase sigma-70 factor (ECF subfamily)
MRQVDSVIHPRAEAVPGVRRAACHLLPRRTDPVATPPNPVRSGAAFRRRATVGPDRARRVAAGPANPDLQFLRNPGTRRSREPAPPARGAETIATTERRTAEVFMQAAASPTRVEEQFLDVRAGVTPASGPGRERGAAAAPDQATLRQHEAWVAAIGRGDQCAFEAFYDATLARAFALARRICVDVSLAEEVVEDAYVQVWRDANRYDAQRGVPLAWLLTITRSRALDALRRRDDAQPVAAPEALMEEADESADPLGLLLLFEETSATRRALMHLPARERQLIGLAFLRGLTHAEIALETGWPLGTIKTSIRRALASMRATLLEHAPAGAGAARGGPGGDMDERAN